MLAAITSVAGKNKWNRSSGKLEIYIGKAQFEVISLVCLVYIYGQ